MPIDSNQQTPFTKTSEKLGRRSLFIGVVGYVMIVALIIGIPYYFKILAPWRETILQVGKTSFTTHDLIKRLRLKPPAQGMDQLESVNNGFQEILNHELTRREALRRGIRVPEQELDRELKRRVMASSSSGGRFEELYQALLRRKNLKEIEYRTWIESDIYQGKLFLSFLERIPEKAEQVHLFVLVTNEIGKAEEIRARLRKGGNFNRLALETSIDRETGTRGGELGWIPRGVDDLIATGQPQASDVKTMTKPETESPGKSIPEGKLIDDIAFHLPIGQVSPPLITDKGIFFVKITAREDQRPLSQNHRILLAEKAMREWLAETARKGTKEGWIKGNWGSETFQWVVKHLN